MPGVARLRPPPAQPAGEVAAAATEEATAQVRGEFERFRREAGLTETAARRLLEAIGQQGVGPEPGLDRGFGSSSVSARRLRVEWSGTARSSPSRAMMEATRPSVWRSARRNTARRASAVAIARSE